MSHQSSLTSRLRLGQVDVWHLKLGGSLFFIRFSMFAHGSTHVFKRHLLVSIPDLVIFLPRGSVSKTRSPFACVASVALIPLHLE